MPGVEEWIHTAAPNVLANLVNNYQQQAANGEMKSYNLQMYALQRQHALEDWNRQTDFKSYQDKLRAAGLNPNLVYGSGVQNIPAVRSSTALPYSPKISEVPSVPVTTAISQMYDNRVKSNQADLLQKQAGLTDEEMRLKRVQSLNGLAATAKTEQDTQQARDLFQYVMEAKRAEIDKMRMETQKSGYEIGKIVADTQYTLAKNEREAAMNSYSLMEAAQRVIHMRWENEQNPTKKAILEQQLANLDHDNRLKQADLDLKNEGIQPHDNMFMRILGRFLKNLNPTSASSEGGDSF